MQVQAALLGQPFDRVEPVTEFPVGPVERGAGLDAGLAGQVDHGEQQVADLVDHGLARPGRRGVGVGGGRRRSRGRRGRELRLHLGELLAHLGRGPRGIRPVEPHRRRPLLEPVGLEQRGQRTGDPGERPSPSLLALDPLPRFRVAQGEQVRMPAAHLVLEGGRDVIRGELAALLRDHELEREVQQEIAQLVADGGRRALAQRIVELEDFLDQVGAQRVPGLRPVPRAALAEIAHHGQCASKR